MEEGNLAGPLRLQTSHHLCCQPRCKLPHLKLSNKPFHSFSSFLKLIFESYTTLLLHPFLHMHQSFKRVKFWGMLDVISISAYFQLLPGRTGGTRTLQQTKLLWRNKAKEVNQWRKNNGLAHKKILVAEFGAMAKGTLLYSSLLMRDSQHIKTIHFVFSKRLLIPEFICFMSKLP